MDLRQRNQERVDQVCTNVSLEDVLRGPGHVAWQLIKGAEDTEHDFAFNEEQLLVIALMIWQLEMAFRDHLEGQQASTATLETLRKLPDDLACPRVGIVGGGGCGKTTIMQKVVVPVLEIFFSKIVLTAPSDRAARGFHPRAKTMHSIACMLPQGSFRTAQLEITAAMRKRLDANQTHAGACVHDEVVQTSAKLFHAAALRTTYARQDVYKLKIAKYAQPCEIFGRISFFAACGDHLQLPPVPKSTSLIASLEGTGDEHKVGAKMFANFDFLFGMHTMKRFTDPTLVAILQKMCGPKAAAKLSDAEWRALAGTEIDVKRLERDPAAFERGTIG